MNIYIVQLIKQRHITAFSEWNAMNKAITEQYPTATLTSVDFSTHPHFDFAYTVNGEMVAVYACREVIENQRLFEDTQF